MFLMLSSPIFITPKIISLHQAYKSALERKNVVIIKCYFMLFALQGVKIPEFFLLCNESVTLQPKECYDISVSPGL